jgi:antitoxin (DNA-binding transcriptional repressor) of toxin-antitoxin stability system
MHQLNYSITIGRASGTTERGFVHTLRCACWGGGWIVAFCFVPLIEIAKADRPFADLAPLAQATSFNPSSQVQGDVQKNNASQFAIDEATEERLLLVFVEQQQPKLLKLLEFMKRKQPAQYEQALKELSKAKQRLNTLEKRDQELYEVELKLWQVRSQLRMLVAEITVADRSAKEMLKNRMADLVEREVDLEVAKLQIEQIRAEQRLAQLKSQLQDRTGDRDATIAKSMKTWENRAARNAPRTKSNKPQE